jgi:hypothetical protein
VEDPVVTLEKTPEVLPSLDKLELDDDEPDETKKPAVTSEAPIQFDRTARDDFAARIQKQLAANARRKQYLLQHLAEVNARLRRTDKVIVAEERLYQRQALYNKEVIRREKWLRMRELAIHQGQTGDKSVSTNCAMAAKEVKALAEVDGMLDKLQPTIDEGFRVNGTKAWGLMGEFHESTKHKKKAEFQKNPFESGIASHINNGYHMLAKHLENKLDETAKEIETDLKIQATNIQCQIDGLARDDLEEYHTHLANLATVRSTIVNLEDKRLDLLPVHEIRWLQESEDEPASEMREKDPNRNLTYLMAKVTQHKVPTLGEKVMLTPANIDGGASITVVDEDYVRYMGVEMELAPEPVRIKAVNGGITVCRYVAKLYLEFAGDLKASGNNNPGSTRIRVICVVMPGCSTPLLLGSNTMKWYHIVSDQNLRKSHVGRPPQAASVFVPHMEVRAVERLVALPTQRMDTQVMKQDPWSDEARPVV